MNTGPGNDQYGTFPGRYPMDINVETAPRIERWRPLVNWALVIPMEIWLCLLRLGAGVVVVLGWFAIMFRGRLPDSWSDYLIGVLRYEWRVMCYLCAWTSQHPGFAVIAGQVDPGTYPAVLYCSRPGPRDRLTVFVRLFMLIPHYVLLIVVGIAADVVLLISWFTVLFTGRWPECLRQFGVGYFRWAFRVQAYAYLVTDVYPPFGFES
jgi:hypothetical protein